MAEINDSTLPAVAFAELLKHRSYDEIFALIPPRLYFSQTCETENITRFHLSIVESYTALFLADLTAVSADERAVASYFAKKLLVAVAAAREYSEVEENFNFNEMERLWSEVWEAFEALHVGDWFEYASLFKDDYAKWKTGNLTL